MEYQHFTEVKDGHVKTLDDCIRVFSRIHGHIDKDQLKDKYEAAFFFLNKTGAEIYQALNAMQRPFDMELAKYIIAPAEIVNSLRMLERCASGSYETLCQQQKRNFAGISTLVPKFRT